MELQNPTERLIVQNVIKRHTAQPVIRRTPNHDNSDEKLNKAPSKLLDVLVQRAPLKFTKSQLSLASGYSIKSSSFIKAISELNTRGFINKSGNDITPTQKGLDYFGVDIPKPQTIPERMAMWKSKLGGGFPGKLFDLLISDPNRVFSKEQVSEQLGYSMISSSFIKGISILNRNGLLEKVDGGLRASGELYI